MNSKGLDVCNSLERDKACWRCCCRDGRKAACHDCPDSLTFAGNHLQQTHGLRFLQGVHHVAGDAVEEVELVVVGNDGCSHRS